VRRSGAPSNESGCRVGPGSRNAVAGEKIGRGADLVVAEIRPQGAAARDAPAVSLARSVGV